MDVNTGELRRLMNSSGVPVGFTLVPDRFSKEAEAFLGDKESAFADMQAVSPLINWAKKEKRKHKNTCSKSNNPANIESQAAKEAGKSYWKHMSDKDNMVHDYTWGTLAKNGRRISSIT